MQDDIARNNVAVANWLVPLAQLMRPHQWTKNAVVLAGVAFSGEAGDPSQLARALMAMLAFCLASSSVYILNDWHDREEDQRHPVKCQRPIAAGKVQPMQALVLGTVLVVAAVVIAWLISPTLAAVISAYIVIMAFYTVWFRAVAYLDVLVIAFGFVLRALAGAVAVNVPLSIWLFVCTLMLALLLGFGKRRHELRMFESGGKMRRPSLAGYARGDIDWVIRGAAILTVGAYALYALAVPTFGRHLPMFLTVPFVAAAIGRYLFLIFRLNLGGAPEVLLVRDKPLLLCIVAWSIAVGGVLVS